jgi:uncharacterized membrane protein (Fun14 family)
LPAQRWGMTKGHGIIGHEHSRRTLLLRQIIRRLALAMVCSMTSLWHGATAQTPTGADTVSTLFIPLVAQLGLGAVVGFVVGFTVKKVSKLAALLVGSLFILLQVLAYYGIVTIDWGPIHHWWTQFVEPKALQGRWETVRTMLFANIPASGGAIPGFIMGLKMG